MKPYIKSFDYPYLKTIIEVTNRTVVTDVAIVSIIGTKITKIVVTVDIIDVLVERIEIWIY